MCGIAGFTNFSEKISYEESKKIVHNLSSKLYNIWSGETSSFVKQKIVMLSKEKNVGKPKDLVTCKYQDNSYTITYSGNLYNSKELKKTLIDNGFKFEGNSDTEIIIKAFIFYGCEVANHLNGVFAFAIWNEKKEELFLARDHFGVKPLFYSIKNKEIVFASEIKTLFEFPSIYPIIDEQGIAELFGIGPAHTPGITYFKDVLELEPATFMIINKNYIVKEKYWKMVSRNHTDNFEKTSEKVKCLLEDSIERQLNLQKPYCTFLSGGLDSSIMTKYASELCKQNGIEKLKTFSVDYKDNDKNLQKTDFQPNKDDEFIEIMVNELETEHKKIVLDTPQLASSLKEAMIARDMPGMADVDSSLLVFCKNVSKYVNIAISGECADEIFAGYPWFFREDSLKCNTFPWSTNVEQRQNLLNKSICEKIDLKKYVDSRYCESLKEISVNDLDDDETKEKKKISYLTMNWFMQTLLDRSDRMATYGGMEIRVPFCDFKIAEYLWNIPWEMKAYKGREKGLLRYIMKDKLPEQVVLRKKSPYPKTWNPSYLEKVKEILKTIMNNSDSPIKQIIDEECVWDIINSNGQSITKPWFGQLMTYPQLMAYLIQINAWLETYKPKIEI